MSVATQTRLPHELIIVLDGPQPPEIHEIVAEIEKNKAVNTRVIPLDQNRGISEATNRGVQEASGAYVGLLDHDDLLEPETIERVTSELVGASYAPDLIYTDHDKIDVHDHRYDPEYKPDWSPETLLSHCFVGHFKIIHRDFFRMLGGFRKEYDGAQDYDFLLRAAEKTDHIIHIPSILYHWRSSPGSTASSASTKPESIEKGRRSVQDALVRRQKRGSVILPETSRQADIGVYAIQFDSVQFTEHVTIIIPTKDRPDLLEPCIQSIRKYTTYPHYEILVINNGETNRQILRFLEQEKVQCIDIQTNTFNFSYLNNQAVQRVKTPFILFLNNDTEILRDDWLIQMLGTLLLDEDIGAVGAKLLFPDQRTQHAGIILGLNDLTAGHANLGMPCEDAGYRSSNNALRNFSAVTAACLLTRTVLFHDVGGFDEVKFPVAYNDVDYCLKLLAQGYRIVHAPDALLLHHQAASRGHLFHSNAEYPSRSHLRHVWTPLLRRDPYYNEHFSRRDGSFRIRSHPRGKRILFVSHNLEYEGASLSLSDLAIRLQERKYHIEVACAQSGPLAKTYERHGIPLHTGKEHGRHPLLDIKRDDFDILFLNTITLAPFLHHEDITAHRMIWCIRESEREYYAQNLPQFSPCLFSRADRVLFVSNATREQYRDLDRGHFRTIYNGIDIAKIDHEAARHDRNILRQELGIEPTDCVITIVGTICPRKGQKEFVSAAISLLKSTPYHLQFFLVGGGTQSTYEEELRTIIQKRGFTDCIHIIPKTPDVHRYYASTDIFVCNSAIESFPRVILEAMAWKLPIVATDVFGIAEQVQHEGEALLIDPHNVPDLTAALRRLIEDPILRATLGQNARRNVAHSFGIDRMIDQYEELFQSISL